MVELRPRRLERGWTVDEVVDELRRLAGRLGEAVPVVRPCPHYVWLLNAAYPRALRLVDWDTSRTTIRACQQWQLLSPRSVRRDRANGAESSRDGVGRRWQVAVVGGVDAPASS